MFFKQNKNKRPFFNTVIIVLCVCVCAQQLSVESLFAQTAASPARLFGTVEFKTILKDMPKWQRIAASEQKNPTFTDKFSSLLPKSLAERWDTIVSNSASFSEQDKIKAVNMFFNQWPYRTDLSLYGLEDYWATPREFLKKSGDCEDYATIKFYALKFLGFSEDKMRLVVLKDTIRSIGHAVLAVYTDNNVYILDNLSNVALSHKSIRNYLPFFSLNLQFRWAHLPVKKKQ